MTTPPKEGYKYGGRGKKKGLEQKMRERDTREERKIYYGEKKVRLGL